MATVESTAMTRCAATLSERYGHFSPGLAPHPPKNGELADLGMKGDFAFR